MHFKCKDNMYNLVNWLLIFILFCFVFVFFFSIVMVGLKFQMKHGFDILSVKLDLYLWIQPRKYMFLQ